MIVVDTSIIAYMTFPGRHSAVVNDLHEKNSNWDAPALWRSEFLNILALYYRKGLINENESLDALEFAERLIGAREHRVSPKAILDASMHSSCSSYECEFVVLARQFGTTLITYDKRLLKEFPELAISPEDYLRR